MSRLLSTKLLKYFKSDADFVVFVLLQTEGRTRCDLLRISKIHYYSQKLAQKWYDNLIEIIINHPDYDIAKINLDKIFATMLPDDDDDDNDYRDNDDDDDEVYLGEDD